MWNRLPIALVSIVDVVIRKIRELVLAGSREKLERIIRDKLAKRSKPKTSDVNPLRRRLQKLDGDIDRAADRLLRAPDDLLDTLAPKLSAMKRERVAVQRELQRAEVDSKEVDVDATARAAAAKLWTLADELDKADAARVRDVFQRFIDRVELRFDHVQRGKRVECPFAYGEITLNEAMFPIGSRGERI
jgi:hypothetical protein